jgi:thymidylate synthase
MDNIGLNIVNIDAHDLDDAWFQCLSKILEKGHVYKIDRGSYEGQRRLEFDFITLRVRNPASQIIPIIPEGMNIPAPTSMEYVHQYLPYLLSGTKTEKEDYTYSERLINPKVKINRNVDGKNITEEVSFGCNQIEEVIKMFKTQGYGTNQATMEIGMPSDILLKDPPCCRLIDLRIRYGKLHFIIYMRSWDLWAGLPSNLGGMELVKQYMAEEIGVGNGEIIACSKGLHLYEYVWELAKMRTYKTDLKIGEQIMPITPDEANDKFLEREDFIKSCHDKQYIKMLNSLDSQLEQHDFIKNKVFYFCTYWCFEILDNYWAIRHYFKNTDDYFIFAENIKEIYKKLGWYVLVMEEKSGNSRNNNKYPVLYFAKQPLKIQKRFWGLFEKVIINEK